MFKKMETEDGRRDVNNSQFTFLGLFDLSLLKNSF